MGWIKMEREILEQNNMPEIIQIEMEKRLYLKGFYKN